MNKALKITLIVVASVILTVVLLTVALVAFVGYVWGGMRLTPEAAANAVGLHTSELPYIEGDGCRFYYETVKDIYGDGYLADPSAGHDDWIYEIRPVKREGLLWYAMSGATGGALIYQKGGDERVGSLRYVEVDGKYHYFIAPELYATEQPCEWTPPYEFTADFDSVVIDGVEFELFKHSYFVTDEKVTELELGGVKYEVK